MRKTFEYVKFKIKKKTHFDLFCCVKCFFNLFWNVHTFVYDIRIWCIRWLAKKYQYVDNHKYFSHQCCRRIIIIHDYTTILFISRNCLFGLAKCAHTTTFTSFRCKWNDIYSPSCSQHPPRCNTKYVEGKIYNEPFIWRTHRCNPLIKMNSRSFYRSISFAVSIPF